MVNYEHFPLWFWEQGKTVCFHHFYSAFYSGSSHYDKARQRNKSNQIGKEIKLSLFVSGMIGIYKISTRINMGI